MYTEQKCESGWTAECIRLYAVKRAKPFPGPGTLGKTERRARGRKHQSKFFIPQRGQNSVSQRVFAR